MHDPDAKIGSVGRSSSVLWWTAISLLAALFLINGLSLLPYPGIQNDEAFFSVALYRPSNVASVLSVFKHRIPMMHLNYVGTLKSFLYAPILKVWPPDRISVRLPVLLAGVAALLLFALLARRASNPAAAAAAAGLLATDPVFLLTNLFDWGPVTLQHLLVLAGCLLFLRFAQGASRRSLCAGAFLFGLALWNKALVLWTFAALLIAVVAVFPKEFARALTRRNLALVLVCFSVGAFPFLRHNIQRPLASFRGNAGFSLAGARTKFHVMKGTLDGSGLFGYLVYDDPVPSPNEPESGVERFSVSLSHRTGRPHRTLFPWLLLTAALLAPLWWSSPARHPILFAAIVLLLMWVQMLVARGAGSGVHHTVLAWPWPHLLVGVAFVEAARRARRWTAPLAAAALLAACLSGLLVTNQYRAQFIRNGAARSWTDAIFPLSALLKRLPARQIVIVDWGIVDNLRLLHQGCLPLTWGAPPLLSPSSGEAEKQRVRVLISSPDNLFIGHTAPYEQFAGIHQRLLDWATQAGFRKDLLYVVRDRNGRAVYEVFRFLPVSSGPARAAPAALTLPDRHHPEHQPQFADVARWPHRSIHLERHLHHWRAGDLWRNRHGECELLVPLGHCERSQASAIHGHCQPDRPTHKVGHRAESCQV